MGNSISSFGGQSRVQSLINKSGLPLQIDDSTEDDAKTPLSTFTEAYPAPGWFTGVKSAITIQKPVSEVYKSLSKDLHHVFTPMSECDDEITEDDGKGGQSIFRVVRIPFKVAFVTGNLKLRLNVKQDSKTNKIHFESVKEGRLITRFIADFDIQASEDRPEETIVKLDSKVNCKSLPPPPFKNMVKDVMVRKMDSCMVDLLNYHSQEQPVANTEGEDEEEEEDEFESASETSLDAREPTKRYSGFMDMVRSLSAPLRRSMELFDGRRSVERGQKIGLDAAIVDTAHDNAGHAAGTRMETPPTSSFDVARQSALYQPTPSTAASSESDSKQNPPSEQKLSTDLRALDLREDIGSIDQTESVADQARKVSSQTEVFAAWQGRKGIQAPPNSVFLDCR